MTLELTINGAIYNVTLFKGHPGGQDVFRALQGTDATAAYYAYHSHQNDSRLSRWFQRFSVKSQITGSLLELDILKATRFLELAEITKPDWKAYRVDVLRIACLFALTLTFAHFDYPTFSAVMLGLFWQQLAFIGHDLGHNSVFNRPKWNKVVGVALSALLGVSFSWWKATHNVHHIATNKLEVDPDRQYLPLFALSADAVNGYFSVYHRKHFRPFFGLIRVQHLLYYPVMCVARFNLYAQSFVHVYRNYRHDWWSLNEVFALLVFWVWFPCLVYAVSGHQSTLVALAFILTSHAVAGILHVQITLSHFAMPGDSIVSNAVQEKWDYGHRQFATCLDIDCPPWLDFIHGGLQFQLAHHLFPRVPRHRLREVTQSIAIPLAAKYKLKYKSMTFFHANFYLLRHLRHVGSVQTYPVPRQSSKK
jgi:fatty acid desaturase